MTGAYSITELSREFTVTPRTLRFYEDKGLLSPIRQGTTRIYSDRERTRLKLVLRGTRLGFSLQECREIIDTYDPTSRLNTRQLLRLCTKIREHRNALLAKMRDMEATLSAMDEVEQTCLGALIANAA